MTTYELHPLCRIFPAMSERELLELAEDIEKNGQREPIHTFEGYVLDGRNRLAACGLIGREPWIEALDPTQVISPLAFVISKNLFRRHLKESQRAMVAGRIATLEKGQRVDRQICRSTLPAVSQAEAAVLLNVSPRLVGAARKVLEHGTEELIGAVDAGQLSLSAAARIATLPSDEQQAFLAARGGATKLVGARAAAPEQPLCDALGHSVPARLTGVFADCRLYEQAERQFEALSRRLAVLARRRSGSGYYLSRYVEKIQQNLGMLRDTVRSLMPYAAADDAERGWLPEFELRDNDAAAGG